MGNSGSSYNSTRHRYNNERSAQSDSHQQAMKELELRAQAARREHEKQMKQIKVQQKDKAIKSIIAIVNQLQQKISSDTKSQESSKKELEITSKTLAENNKTISGWQDYMNKKLFKEKQQLDEAKKSFDRDDLEIQKAIQKTGQHEENVGKFLRLTHGLIGATMQSQSESDKLEIMLSTFGGLLARECQDRLSIETLFTRNQLTKFISICDEHDFHAVEDLVCENEDEFKNDILPLLEKGIAKQLKKVQNEKAKSNNQQNHPELDDVKQPYDVQEPEDEEEDEDTEQLARDLLEKWKLKKIEEISKRLIDEEGWDDPNDWKDIPDDDLKSMGIKGGNMSKFKRGLKKWQGNDELISTREKRILQKICLNPNYWKKEQESQTKITKQTLEEISPLLGVFFNKIQRTMGDAQKLLTYKEELNDDQKKAIKLIESKAETNDNDDQKKDDDDSKIESIDKTERNEFMLGSQCEIFSDSSKKWLSGEIVDKKTDDEGTWLEVQYKVDGNKKTKQVQPYSQYIRPEPVDSGDQLTNNCRALTKASILSINVVQSMQEQFNKNELTKKGLGIAEGIEGSCLQIIHSQGDMRRSVLLANNILTLKPSNLTNNETVKLWNAVDNGIGHIFKCALDMVQITYQYFAFFAKFKQSFGHFNACYQIDENASLAVATQYIQKDVREFDKFTKNFTQSVEKLRDEASKCIGNCVKQQSGYENFEKSQASVEKTRQIWIQSQKEYGKEEQKLIDELNIKIDETIELFGKEKQYEYKVKSLKQSLEENKKYLEQYSESLKDLQTMII